MRPVPAPPPWLSFSTHGPAHDSVPALPLYDALLKLSRSVPPVPLVFAVLPATPLVRSHARNVMPLETVPFQFAFETKRTDVAASAASSRAAPAEGVPKLVHVDPELSEYCHVPFVLSTAVTAMPVTAAGSTSLVMAAISADT